MKRGVFITFEGVEGCGKTTQAKALYDALQIKKIPSVFVREPGGTDIGESIRKIILNPEHSNMHAKCEVLLFLAARSQVTYEKILPALRQREIVISDRFYDSTVAYQVYGRDLPRRLISIFNRFATAGIKPDLTFLVDLDISKGRTRGTFDDRMESEHKKYHQKVREGYLKIAHRAKKRVKIIDGDKSIEDLHKEVMHYVKDILVRKGFAL